MYLQFETRLQKGNKLQNSDEDLLCEIMLIDLDYILVIPYLIVSRLEGRIKTTSFVNPLVVVEPKSKISLQLIHLHKIRFMLLHSGKWDFLEQAPSFRTLRLVKRSVGERLNKVQHLDVFRDLVLLLQKCYSVVPTLPWYKFFLL